MNFGIGGSKNPVLLENIKPFAHVLLPSEKGTRCDFCFKRGKLKVCSCCNLMYYCSPECIKTDWKPCHRYEHDSGFIFRLLKQFYQERDQKFDFEIKVILLFRMLVKLLVESAWKKKFTLAYVRDMTFDDITVIQRHPTDFDPRWKTYVETMCTFFNERAHTVEEEDIFIVLNKMETFNIDICNSVMEPIGKGFYVELASLKHSCLPTCGCVFDGTLLNVRALKATAKYSDNTVNLMGPIGLPYEERIRDLQRRNIKCNCELCKLSQQQAIEKDIDWRTIKNAQGWINYRNLKTDSESQKYAIKAFMLAIESIKKVHGLNPMITAYKLRLYHLHLRRKEIKFGDTVKSELDELAKNTHGSNHPIFASINAPVPTKRTLSGDDTDKKAEQEKKLVRS